MFIAFIDTFYILVYHKFLQSHVSKVWDEITYPFLNFNGATIEV